MLKLTLPLHVDLPRKRGKPKRIYLTFNSVKTLHFQVYNQAKHMVHDLIRDQIGAMGWHNHVPEPAKVTCYLYNTGERQQDLDNCFIAVKFALDAIVTQGYLYDDSVKYVKSVQYLYGGIDKANPRYEIVIESM